MDLEGAERFYVMYLPMPRDISAYFIRTDVRDQIAKKTRLGDHTARPRPRSYNPWVNSICKRYRLLSIS